MTCRKSATTEKNAAPLTAKELRELLYLCPTTKVLYWIKTPKSGPAASRAGQRAGYLDKSKNRWAITIRGSEYWVSRLVWLYENGEWPTDQVDHIDGDPSDNRRLRLVSNSLNQRNAKRRSDNKSGHKGVFLSNGKWLAYIYNNGQRQDLGWFRNIDEAIAVREAAAFKMFGEYAREE